MSNLTLDQSAGAAPIQPVGEGVGAMVMSLRPIRLDGQHEECVAAGSWFGAAALVRWAFAVSAAVAVYSSGGIASAQTAPPAGAPPHSAFEPPFPFDANDLWSKLSQVTALHGDGVTPERIGGIFGVKLKRPDGQPSNPNTKSYSVKAHIDWYYDVYVVEYDNKNHFLFGWGQYPGSYSPFPKPLDGICISPSVVKKTLTDQGWVFSGHNSLGLDGARMPEVIYYQFNKNGIAMGFDLAGNCLITIRM